MQETDYCAHAIDGLRELIRRKLPPLVRGTMEGMLPQLTNSIHFRLPDNGQLFTWPKGKKLSDIASDYCSTLRLPFPLIAIEYAVPNAELREMAPENTYRHDAAIILAFEEGRAEGKYIILSPLRRIFVDGRKLWAPENFAVAIATSDNSIQILPQTEEGGIIGGTSSLAVEDTQASVIVFVNFMAALACSNSVAMDAPPPSPKLNAKRRKAGKTPFFTYKILTISGNSPQNSEAGGGTHGSPRVHLRRGHIRRLPEKTVWVNACVVGDKSKGLIQKDYKVV